MTGSKSWGEYWSQGHKTSFGNAYSHCYEGKLQETWQRVFNTIPSNTRVLDLCTGNASLLRLAEKDMVNFSEVLFTGVDYANISAKDNFTELNNIELLFSVSVENLPLEDNSLDVVISNFGIEYSDLFKSLSEVSRVLSMEGNAVFVCHFYDSIFIKNNAQELAMIKELLAESGVVELLEGLTASLALKTRYSQLQTSNEYLEAVKEAEHYRHLLNQQLNTIANNFSPAFHQSDLLGFLKFLLSRKEIDKQSELAIFKKNMISHQARLSEMINAALTKAKIENLPFFFQEHGLVITKAQIINSEQGAIGYQIFSSKDNIKL